MKLLVSSSGKALIGASGKLADKNCCCFVSCPTVSLVCDSISASKTKCGFGGFEAATFYLRKDEIDNWSCSKPAGGDNYTSAGSTTRTDEYDPATCVRTLSCSGTVTEHCPICDPVDCTNTYVLNGNECDFLGGCGAALGLCDCFSCIPETVSDTQQVCDDPGCSTGGTATETLQENLSEEYTTALLVSTTIAALPPYLGTYFGSCSAVRNLSSDESSYSIQRFKYKFTIPTALSNDLHIYWTERFTPIGGGSPTDTAKNTVIGVGSTESSLFEVLEPSTNGTTTVVNIRWAIDPACHPTILDGCTPGTSDCTGSYDDCCQVVPPGP